MLLQNGFYNPDITHDTRALRISQEENEKSFINIHRIYKEIQNVYLMRKKLVFIWNVAYNG